MNLELTKENLIRCYKWNVDSYKEQAQEHTKVTDLYHHYMGMSHAFQSMIELLDDYKENK